VGIPDDLLQRMLGDPGDLERLRADAAEWVHAHPEDAAAVLDGMEGVEQVAALPPDSGSTDALLG
jgi:hypothetical protein